ncbi:AfsR/SARP family transcriptional regulator [Streptosporangium sp. NPDC023615]|uniref:AfsR/SARP family transcriptional regulator n=1 Tax=Streptosporangium sp. NPDC023615 TaxID=3154794 RepID=UPI00343E76A2
MAALLLEKGNAVPFERLVLALWDDPPPASAAKNLRLYVSQLRRQLRAADPSLGDCLATLRGGSGSGYRLTVDPGDVDVHRFAWLADRGFQALRRGSYPDVIIELGLAIQLWKGSVGQDCRASARLRARFDKFAELSLVAQERLIEAKLALGYSMELISDILSVIDQDPLREHGWGHLMCAYYFGGYPDKAYVAYGQLHEKLESQLGREPSQDLNALRYAISHDDRRFVRQWRFGNGEFPSNRAKIAKKY